jgi:hypothetical protein
MDYTKILKRAFELSFQGKRSEGRPQTRWFIQVLEDIEKIRQFARRQKWSEKRNWKLIKLKLC